MIAKTKARKKTRGTIATLRTCAEISWYAEFYSELRANLAREPDVFESDSSMFILLGGCAPSPTRAGTSAGTTPLLPQEGEDAARAKDVWLLRRMCQHGRRTADNGHAVCGFVDALVFAALYACNGNTKTLVAANTALTRALQRENAPGLQKHARRIAGAARRAQSTIERNADLVRRVRAKMESEGQSAAQAQAAVAYKTGIPERTVRDAWERRPK